MKPKQIKEEMKELEHKVRHTIRERGVLKTASDLKMSASYISDFLSPNNKTRWSYEKLIEVAEGLGI